MRMPPVRRQAVTVDLGPKSGSGPQDRRVPYHIDSATSAQYDTISTRTLDAVCRSDEKEKADP
jgi:hypothetical protein